MIRHHDPGMQFVEVPPAVPDQNGFSYQIGDGRLLEP